MHSPPCLRLSRRQFPLITLRGSRPTYHTRHVTRASVPTPTSHGLPLSNTWADRLPPRIRPYVLLMRAEKPIGTLLLFYPCAWSITMASYALHVPASVPATYLGIFGIGAVIMRGAGCIINDLWDRKLDRAVDRTKNRPLAQGIISPPQAIAFLGGQLALGLMVLLQLNWYSILLGASSLPIVTLYPFMKRVTYWPQLFLGLAFNYGALLGWSAVAGATNWEVCLPLYAGGICWTLVYDSIYAHQDKLDDEPAGIRSTAILFGENTRPILGMLSAGSVSCLTLAGVLNAHGLPFFVGVGLAGAQLARIVYTTDYDDRMSCWRGFTRCGLAGLLIWAGALGDFLFQIAVSPGETKDCLVYS